MANPQKENGYTAIANEILDELIRYKFPPKSSLPFRLCLYIIRKTYGYHKKMDIISLSQFQKGTSEKNRSNLVYWLNFLVQAKILVKIKKDENTVEYGFNKDYEQWLPLVQARTLVQARSYSSASIDTKTSASNNTYKRKKEITKETTEQSSENTGKVIFLFKDINPSYKILFPRKAQHAAARRLLDREGFEKLEQAVEFLRIRKIDKFCPQISSPSQLEEKWAALEKYAIGLRESLKVNAKPQWKIWT